MLNLIYLNIVNSITQDVTFKKKDYEKYDIDNSDFYISWTE